MRVRVNVQDKNAGFKLMDVWMQSRFDFEHRIGTTIVLDYDSLSEVIKWKLGEANFKVADALSKGIQTQLMIQNNIWKGRLINSVKATKVNSRKSIVTMLKYGFDLDSRKTRWVKLKRGRNIYKWAKDKGGEHLADVVKRQGSIRVKKHPFIDEGIRRGLIRQKPILALTFN